MKAIRCKCGCIYPDDMTRCPSCQCATDNNIKHVLTESKNTGVRGSDPSTWRPSKTHTVNAHQSTSVSLTPCRACGRRISVKAESCPHCGQPTGNHICPKCNSVNTRVISGASKVVSIFLWGPFAANKVVSKFQCKDCGHKW